MTPEMIQQMYQADAPGQLPPEVQQWQQMLRQWQQMGVAGGENPSQSDSDQDEQMNHENQETPQVRPNVNPMPNPMAALNQIGRA